MTQLLVSPCSLQPITPTPTTTTKQQAPSIMSSTSGSSKRTTNSVTPSAAATNNKDTNRGNYRCGRCGQPKVNHVCEFIDLSVASLSIQVLVINECHITVILTFCSSCALCSRLYRRFCKTTKSSFRSPPSGYSRSPLIAAPSTTAAASTTWLTA